MLKFRDESIPYGCKFSYCFYWIITNFTPCIRFIVWTTVVRAVQYENIFFTIIASFLQIVFVILRMLRRFFGRFLSTSRRHIIVQSKIRADANTTLGHVKKCRKLCNFFLIDTCLLNKLRRHTVTQVPDDIWSRNRDELIVTHPRLATRVAPNPKTSSVIIPRRRLLGCYQSWFRVITESEQPVSVNYSLRSASHSSGQLKA